MVSRRNLLSIRGRKGFAPGNGEREVPQRRDRFPGKPVWRIWSDGHARIRTDSADCPKPAGGRPGMTARGQSRLFRDLGSIRPIAERSAQTASKSVAARLNASR